VSNSVSPTPAGAGAPSLKLKSFIAAERTKFIVFGVGAAALLWASWATHAILDVRKESTPLVKVQLAELLRGYVQAEARSGVPADQMTQQTAMFLKAMNEAVAAHVRRGQVVLLSNAVVDGNIPDITDEVRAAVYSQVPRPQPGAPQGMSPEMQQIFAPNGTANGAAH
jgi:hypothetical protein